MEKNDPRSPDFKEEKIQTANFLWQVPVGN
jgi:hypothetical protein